MGSFGSRVRYWVESSAPCLYLHFLLRFAELASSPNVIGVIDFCTFAEDRRNNGSLGGALNLTDMYGEKYI